MDLVIWSDNDYAAYIEVKDQYKDLPPNLSREFVGRVYISAIADTHKEKRGSKMGIFDKFLGKKKHNDRTSTNHRKENLHDKPLSPGKDVPVPVANVVEVELALIKESPVEDDRKWLDKALTVGDIIGSWAPGLLEGIAELNPNARLSRHIVKSAKDNIEFVVQKSKSLNVNLITTEPRCLRIIAPDGSIREDEFMLSLYIRVDPQKKADVVMLVAANHRFVPYPQSRACK